MSSPTGQILFLQYLNSFLDSIRKKRKTDRSLIPPTPIQGQYIGTLYNFLEYDKQHIYNDVISLQQRLADMNGRVKNEGAGSVGFSEQDGRLVEDTRNLVNRVKDLKNMVGVLEKLLIGLEEVVDFDVEKKIGGRGGR